MEGNMGEVFTDEAWNITTSRDCKGIGGTREGINLAGKAVLEVPIIHNPVCTSRCVRLNVPCDGDLAETKELL
jgi:hypothetical protein